MQLQGENLKISAPPRVGPIAVGMRIIQQDGAAALFSGVSATVLRQTLYSTTRMGLYDMMKTKWTDPETGNMRLWKKIGAGLIAGGIGAAVGNPADVAMVRMQADGRLPAPMARFIAYGEPRHVSDSVTIGVIRSDQGDDIGERCDGGWARDSCDREFCRRVCGLGGHKPGGCDQDEDYEYEGGAGKAPPYAGAIDCALQTIRSEGLIALYKGFIPTISRQGPFTVVLFVTLEQVRKLLKDF
ncbi:hypothetical protein SSX86_019295 [Deinandra increscens subsp. villosa]|uniref:Mitochondrial uncoupling protein n=1 Tax=Deinandra increscens subsp. villosa TaxID=3103831 RepID=A0AAP0CSC3_9ASTR